MAQFICTKRRTSYSCLYILPSWVHIILIVVSWCFFQRQESPPVGDEEQRRCTDVTR